MANTTNFGWATTDDTDLVKDGAAAIRTLGSSIDTSFVDLKGGTTGQILAKASNTDLDFTWSNDAGISPTIFDAKADLLTATAADTPARLAVGTNGQVLSADSTESTGLKWITPAAGGGYTQLASGNLSGSSVNLTSISGSYKQLRVILKDYVFSSRDNFRLRFNNDTGSNYVGQGVTGTFSGAGYSPIAESSTGWSSTYAWICQGKNVFTTGGENFAFFDIPDYANTDTFKIASGAVFQRDNTNDYVFSVESYLWRNTAAISQINLIAGNGQTFSAGTYLLLGLN
jgi:hypothetical protein